MEGLFGLVAIVGVIIAGAIIASLRVARGGREGLAASPQSLNDLPSPSPNSALPDLLLLESMQQAPGSDDSSDATSAGDSSNSSDAYQSGYSDRGSSSGCASDLAGTGYDSGGSSSGNDGGGFGGGGGDVF